MPVEIAVELGMIVGILVLLLYTKVDDWILARRDRKEREEQRRIVEARWHMRETFSNVLEADFDQNSRVYRRKSDDQVVMIEH